MNNLKLPILALLAALVAAAPAQAGSFTVPVDTLYDSLASTVGGPFADGAAADVDGVDGPDKDQQNVQDFAAYAFDDQHASHEDVHDAWINNFLLAKFSLEDHSSLDADVIENLSEIIGLFMTIQTPEMDAAMESLWMNTLGISSPDFHELNASGLHWEQAEVFGGDHGDDDHDHGHGDDGDPGRSGHRHVGEYFKLELPADADNQQPIQWYKDGQALTDLGGIRLGSQGTVFEIFHLLESDTGSYTATYTDDQGQEQNFGPVAIEVVDHEHDDHAHMPAASAPFLAAAAAALAGYALGRKNKL
jgi:hypothetical protein